MKIKGIHSVDVICGHPLRKILQKKNKRTRGKEIEKKTALLCSPEFCPQILCPSGSNKYSLRHLVEVVTGVPTPLVCMRPFKINSLATVSSFGPGHTKKSVTFPNFFLYFVNCSIFYSILSIVGGHSLIT